MNKTLSYSTIFLTKHDPVHKFLKI